MVKRLAFSLLVGLPLCGCANLVVTKVPTTPHESQKDEDIKGFRYYLSRPYVIVKEPIFVFEEVVLLAANRDNTGTVGAAGASGLNQGLEQAAAQGGLSRVNPRTSALEPVSPAEWAVMREALQQQAELTPVAHHRTLPAAASTPVNVQVTNLTAGTEGDPLGSQFMERVSALEQNKGTVQGTGTTKADDVTASTQKTVDLKGKIQVVFLPDMDEQYAVHNRNIMAKSDYQLHFRDGWQLAAVSGEFDSTTVAVDIFKTIDSAINAAKTVGLAALGGGGGAAAPSSKERVAIVEDARLQLVERVTRTYISPGMYRINKPWEMDGTGDCRGAGLLIKLGLKMVTTVEWRLAHAVNPPDRPTGSTCPPK